MFTLREHCKKMNMEDVIVNTALVKLNEIPDVEGIWGKDIPVNIADDLINEIDGTVEITILNEVKTFIIEVKKELRTYQLPDIFKKAKIYENFLIIAENIFPKIKEQLRENNIAYIDTQGNAYIKTDRNLIWIEHDKKTEKGNNVRNRAFTKTGIKVLFLYLHDKEWINRPYREVAEMAGVALGAIPPVINGLKQLGYLVNIDEKRYQLVNKEELLNKWAEAYGEKLKPTLKIGNFFLNNVSINNWRDINYKDEDILWGGEPAADLLTNYLNPEKLTIYTTKTTKELMIDFDFYPDENGQIAVFQKFWNFPGENQNAIPPVLVYADLINTNDSRCIETARLIYDKYLRENL